MTKKTSETETALLIVAAQLLQAADVAPGNLRKRLAMRAEQLLDEADAEASTPEELPWQPPYAPGYGPGWQERRDAQDERRDVTTEPPEPFAETGITLTGEVARNDDHHETGNPVG